MSETFVRAFANFWRAPDPEHLGALLHDDVVLTQPLAPPIRGLERAKRAFRHNLGLVPDLHAIVDRGRSAEGGAVIEFRLLGHLGRRPLEWPVVDLFRLRDGKAVERASYFDTLPLLGALLTTPAAWPRWLRAGAARPWAQRRPRPGVSAR